MNISFGERLVEALKARNVPTQKDLAAHIGMSVSQISDIKKRFPNIEVGTVMRIATYLDVSLHWLLTGDGPMIQESVNAASIDRAMVTATLRRIAGNAAEIARDATGLVAIVEGHTMTEEQRRAAEEFIRAIARMSYIESAGVIQEREERERKEGVRSNSD